MTIRAPMEQGREMQFHRATSIHDAFDIVLQRIFALTRVKRTMLDELVGSFFGMPRDQAVRCLAEVVDVSFLEESSATHKMTPDNSI